MHSQWIVFVDDSNFIFIILYMPENKKDSKWSISSLNVRKLKLSIIYVQSFAKDWRIFIVLKTWKMRQSLACQFLTAFSRNFLVKKIDNYKFWGHFEKVFYEIRQRNRFTGRDRWTLGIDWASELLRKCFWPKIGDFDKAHQKILEFWKFREFLENASIFGDRLYIYEMDY